MKPMIALVPTAEGALGTPEVDLSMGTQVLQTVMANPDFMPPLDVVGLLDGARIGFIDAVHALPEGDERDRNVRRAAIAANNVAAAVLHLASDEDNVQTIYDLYREAEDLLASNGLGFDPLMKVICLNLAGLLTDTGRTDSAARYRQMASEIPEYPAQEERRPWYRRKVRAN